MEEREAALHSLIQALLTNQPYFGSAYAAGMLRRDRRPVLEAAVRLVGGRFDEPISILEVGSWMGNSAVLMAQAMLASCHKGSKILCVDPWEPYHDLSANTRPQYSEMNQVSASGVTYLLFEHNVRTSGMSDCITHRRGYSRDILPTLPQAHFHMIFVDASHLYEDLRDDLALVKPLLKEGGILCGDDWELSRSEVDDGSHLRAIEERKDCVTDPKTDRRYHPGVTQVLHELMPDACNYAGVWIVEKCGDTYRGIRNLMAA